MNKPFHPLQVEILKYLYDKKKTIYFISKHFQKPTDLIRFHVKQLHKKGLLIRKENENGKGFVYTVNKKRVKIDHNNDKVILFITI